MQGGFGNSFVADKVAGAAGQSAAPPALPPGFDANALADRLHAAMDGWGTDERAIFDVLYSGGPAMNQAVQRAYAARYGGSLEADLRSELSGADLEKALTLLRQGRLTLADQIREGARGWGTDETRIFRALERATPQERSQVARDPAVLAILESELSEDDMRLVRAYLSGDGVLAARLRHAVEGWGTDEQEIWTALEKASPAEKAFVLNQPALTRKLRSDLSEADWMKCRAILRGELDNVQRIEMAMAGWGTDEEALKSAIAGLTADEYARLPDDIDERIASELSGRDRVIAEETLHQKRLELDADYRNRFFAETSEDLGQAAMASAGTSVLLRQGDQTMSIIGRIKAACAGLGTNDTELWRILSELTAEERSFILTHNPQGVLGVLQQDLSGPDYAKVVALLGGGGASTLVSVATAGAGTDETLVYHTLERVVAEGRTQALLADETAMESLRRDLSQKRFDLVVEVLTRAEFTPRQRLLWATLDAGTDEALVFEIAERWGSHLRQGDGIASDVDEILKAELSTRDYWRALDLIRGEPRTESERLARAKELLERERGGVSTALMDAFSASGERADDAWREYQATYNTALQDGEISPEEVGQLRRDEAFSKLSTREYADTKASVAMWATQVALAIVGTAATLMTMGAAGPFVAGIAASLGGSSAVAAEAMVLGAALKVGLNRAILGEGYDLASADALLDAVGASIEVGLNVLGAHVGARMMKAASTSHLADTVGPAVERVFGPAGKRILAQGAEGAIDGGLSGIGDGAFRTAAHESTWEGDVEHIFSTMGQGMGQRFVTSASGGFASKAAFASIGEVWGARVRAKYGDDPSRYPVPGDPELDETGKVIRKTQDEALPELREKHAGKPYEDFENGKAFVKGRTDETDISPDDVKQGALGDCYLMAGMAATARAEPDAIRRIIKDNGDGTFEVTLYIRKSSWSRPVAMTRTIDARLPTNGNGRPLYAGIGDATEEGDELWPALLEKRLAQEKGSYELISGGNISRQGFNFAGATELFTGKAERYFSTASLTEDKVLAMMDDALTRNKPITVDSMNMEKMPDLTREANQWNVYGNHAYAVESVDLASRTVNLQNPWGSNHVKNLPIKDFMRFYRAVRVGGG
ncbi:MAG: hypothetical protein D6798_03685 [Deltaproteobacteria bacterium]|nr:MAG: hypothetical protein D6798_03685 [Deltaproteobacteria bacterium]